MKLIIQIDTHVVLTKQQKDHIIHEVKFLSPYIKADTETIVVVKQTDSDLEFSLEASFSEGRKKYIKRIGIGPAMDQMVQSIRQTKQTIPNRGIIEPEVSYVQMGSYEDKEKPFEIRSKKEIDLKQLEPIKAPDTLTQTTYQSETKAEKIMYEHRPTPESTRPKYKVMLSPIMVIIKVLATALMGGLIYSLLYASGSTNSTVLEDIKVLIDLNMIEGKALLFVISVGFALVLALLAIIMLLIGYAKKNKKGLVSVFFASIVSMVSYYVVKDFYGVANSLLFMFSVLSMVVFITGNVINSSLFIRIKEVEDETEEGQNIASPILFYIKIVTSVLSLISLVLTTFLFITVGEQTITIFEWYESILIVSIQDVILIVTILLGLVFSLGFVAFFAQVEGVFRVGKAPFRLTFLYALSGLILHVYTIKEFPIETPLIVVIGFVTILIISFIAMFIPNYYFKGKIEEIASPLDQDTRIQSVVLSEKMMKIGAVLKKISKGLSAVNIIIALGSVLLSYFLLIKIAGSNQTMLEIFKLVKVFDGLFSLQDKILMYAALLVFFVLIILYIVIQIKLMVVAIGNLSQKRTASNIYLKYAVISLMYVVILYSLTNMLSSWFILRGVWITLDLGIFWIITLVNVVVHFVLSFQEEKQMKLLVYYYETLKSWFYTMKKISKKRIVSLGLMIGFSGSILLFFVPFIKAKLLGMEIANITGFSVLGFSYVEDYIIMNFINQARLPMMIAVAQIGYVFILVVSVLGIITNLYAFIKDKINRKYSLKYSWWVLAGYMVVFAIYFMIPYSVAKSDYQFETYREMMNTSLWIPLAYSMFMIIMTLLMAKADKEDYLAISAKPLIYSVFYRLRYVVILGAIYVYAQVYMKPNIVFMTDDVWKYFDYVQFIATPFIIVPFIIILFKNYRRSERHVSGISWIIGLLTIIFIGFLIGYGRQMVLVFSGKTTQDLWYISFQSVAFVMLAMVVLLAKIRTYRYDIKRY